MQTAFINFLLLIRWTAAGFLGSGLSTAHPLLLSVSVGGGLQELQNLFGLLRHQVGADAQVGHGDGVTSFYFFSSIPLVGSEPFFSTQQKASFEPQIGRAS